MNFFVKIAKIGLTFCRWRGGLAGVGSDQCGGDRVDPSPRDHWLQHVLKEKSKWIKVDGLPVATWSLSRASDRHRGFIGFKSSDGCDFSRSGALHDHLMFIRRLRSFAIWATRGASWCVRSPSCGRQRIARSTAIVRITITWISIWRRRPIVEELHDRGPIEPRSRRDRAAIGRLTWGNRCQSIKRRSTDGQDHDRGPIAVQSWPDRGRNDGYSKQNLRPTWEFWVRPKEALSRPCKTAPMTASTAHDSGPISLFKSMYFPLLFLNFWSIRERIKRISRKILSSS